MALNDRVTTPRLRLRKPVREDAQAIFDNYASDRSVTRYLSWPRHENLSDTQGFLDFSTSEWDRWPLGPYVIELRSSDVIIGSTGLSFETPYRASTGYVLSKEAWGQGYATEALAAVMKEARTTDLWRVSGLCHHEHVTSARVMEKEGFEREARLRCHSIFPNLDSDQPQDVLLYSSILRAD